jgi:hypothetical protein
MELCTVSRRTICAALLSVGVAAAFAISTSAQAAYPGCKTIPKYPKGTAALYATDSRSSRTEDIVEEYANDSVENVKAWYAQQLPGWKFTDHSTGQWPPSLNFNEPGSTRAVIINLGKTPIIIMFICDE